MTTTWNISTIYKLAARCESLLGWRLVIGDEHAGRELVPAETPRYRRHRLSSSEYPTAPIFPRYQY